MNWILKIKNFFPDLQLTKWHRIWYHKMILSIIYFNFHRAYGKANLKSLFTGKSSCWQEMVHLKCSWVPPVTSNQWHVGVEHTKKLILSWAASYMSQSHYIKVLWWALVTKQNIRFGLVWSSWISYSKFIVLSMN